MKKAELFISLCIIFISLSVCIFLLLLSINSTYVNVAVDGEYKGRYSINKNNEVLIETEEGGYNLLIIEDGKAYIKEADCPNKDCVLQGEISKEHQVIICLPHRLTVTISGYKDNETDDISR